MAYYKDNSNSSKTIISKAKKKDRLNKILFWVIVVLIAFWSVASVLGSYAFFNTVSAEEVGFNEESIDLCLEEFYDIVYRPPLRKLQSTVLPSGATVKDYYKDNITDFNYFNLIDYDNLPVGYLRYYGSNVGDTCGNITFNRNNNTFHCYIDFNLNNYSDIYGGIRLDTFFQDFGVIGNYYRIVMQVLGSIANQVQVGYLPITAFLYDFPPSSLGFGFSSTDALTYYVNYSKTNLVLNPYTEQFNTPYLFFYISNSARNFTNTNYLSFDFNLGVFNHVSPFDYSQVSYNSIYPILNFTDTVGYNKGYGIGYSRAYNVGYNAGLSNNNAFGNLLTSVIDAPIKVVSDWLDFDILGINVATFFFGLLSVAVVIFVIKLFV